MHNQQPTSPSLDPAQSHEELGGGSPAAAVTPGAPSGSPTGSPTAAPVAASSSPGSPSAPYDIIPITFQNPNEVLPAAWKVHYGFSGPGASPIMSADGVASSSVSLRVKRGQRRSDVVSAPARRNINEELLAKHDESPLSQPSAGAPPSPLSPSSPTLPGYVGQVQLQAQAAAASTPASPASATPGSASASEKSAAAFDSSPSAATAEEIARGIAQPNPVGPDPHLPPVPSPPTTLPALGLQERAKSDQARQLQRANDELKLQIQEIKDQRDLAEKSKAYFSKRLNEELSRGSPSAQLEVEERINQIYQRTTTPSSPSASPSAPSPSPHVSSAPAATLAHDA